MEILRGVTFHQKKSAVSLGKFDGIHLGHQLLMNEIIKQEDMDGDQLSELTDLLAQHKRSLDLA